ncbi:MAG: hypothetical protein ACREQI_02135 [Candidatus Binataceae bacterium]
MADWIEAAVEGEVDAAVVERLAVHVGISVSAIYGKSGKSLVKKRIDNYNNAAQFRPWLVLVDLDNEFSCAPDLISDWLPNPASFMRFRVAVREVEAWLMADHERFASFLAVKPSVIPANPETLAEPKQVVVNLARYSRRRAIRDDMVPRPGSGRTVGPAYVSRLIEYIRDVKDGWRPNIAASGASSLAKCLRSLASL